MEYHPITLDAYRVAFPLPLPWHVLARTAVDLMAGVVHLQAHHSMHLDLKLDNVLVGYHGGSVLTDFGISRVFDGPNLTLEYVEPFDLLMNRLVLAPEVLEVHDAAKAAARVARRAARKHTPVEGGGACGLLQESRE